VQVQLATAALEPRADVQPVGLPYQQGFSLRTNQTSTSQQYFFSQNNPAPATNRSPTTS
jgi:hypothetical protein